MNFQRKENILESVPVPVPGAGTGAGAGAPFYEIEAPVPVPVPPKKFKAPQHWWKEEGMGRIWIFSN